MEIKLVEQARQQVIQAHYANDEHEQMKAQINQKAAEAANDVVERAQTLMNQLNEAIHRLQKAETTQDAWLGAAWLRNDGFDRLQQALTRLEAFNELAK